MFALFGLMLIVTWLFVLWRLSGDSPETTRRPGRVHGKVGAPRTMSAPPTPMSLEGVLVTHLATGGINRTQYLQEMEKLAARDEQRHPLTVPPETETEP